MDQVALTRGAVADVCAGSQSATHAMDMLGVPSTPMDERTQVDTSWGVVRNEHLELNAGFAHDPDISAYEQMREVCHSRDVTLGRLNAVLTSLDCKPNCMESQAKGKYRDKQNKPLPGVEGDLARSCDEQLLDVFLAVKRIAEERELLVERRDRERERGKWMTPTAPLLTTRQINTTTWSRSSMRVMPMATNRTCRAMGTCPTMLPLYPSPSRAVKAAAAVINRAMCYPLAMARF